jgi:hypothetical protein
MMNSPYYFGPPVLGDPVYLSYTFVIFVVGRKILLHIMSELTGTMVGFDILSINVHVVYFRSCHLGQFL